MTGGGDPGLLDRMAGDSLGWLEGILDEFRLPANVTTDADPNLTLKPLGELAELTRLIGSRHPLPAVRDTADRLFSFAWRETRDGALFTELIRREPHATYPVEIYGVFARAGLRRPDVDALVTATTGLRGWRVAREDHTRTLGILNTEQRIGLPRHTGFDDVLAHTGLGMLREPWALDRRSAYGLTHDVFHLTDWGRAREALPPPYADYLRIWLPAWLDGWMEEQLWDLVGELLAVAACLPDAPYHATAWRRLAEARTADGGIPETGTGPDPGDRYAAFTGCYHSTLVTAFAATLARTAPDGDNTATEGRAPCESEAAS